MLLGFVSDLVEGVLDHGREVRTRWSLSSLPNQTILCFCDLKPGFKIPEEVFILASRRPPATRWLSSSKVAGIYKSDMKILENRTVLFQNLAWTIKSPFTLLPSPFLLPSSPSYTCSIPWKANTDPWGSCLLSDLGHSLALLYFRFPVSSCSSTSKRFYQCIDLLRRD